jgi:plasmid stabilization system protein ParE
MIKRVVIQKRAKRDIREAKLWYLNISNELADDFFTSVDDAIALAQQYPIGFPLVRRTFRRVLLRRFPYALFYQADEDRIVIIAVLHQSRDPEVLRKL